VDPGLSWEAHVSHVVKKCNAILFSLNRIRHYFTSEALEIIVQAYVFPHVTYCLCVWGGTAKGQLHKIQKVINFAARVITGTRKFDHITPSLNSLGWPTIEAMVRHRDALKAFKALRDESSPSEIRALFVPRSAVSTRTTRATDRGSLQLQKYDLTGTQRAFAYRAAVVWNNLPAAALEAPTLSVFKNIVRKL